MLTIIFLIHWQESNLFAQSSVHRRMRHRRAMNNSEKRQHIFTIILSQSIILFILLCPSAFAQYSSAAPIYEPENPFPLLQPDMDRWEYLAPGLYGSIGSVDVRYDRDVVPMFTVKKS